MEGYYVFFIVGAIVGWWVTLGALAFGMSYAYMQRHRDDTDEYTEEEHAMWAKLYDRQTQMLGGRAVKEFYDGLDALGLDNTKIPDFREVNPKLEALTGWKLVTVPGLIPDEPFFTHLANRQFPVGRFIRKPHEIDYLQEPDIFHDVFGHAPLLGLPVFCSAAR